MLFFLTFFLFFTLFSSSNFLLLKMPDLIFTLIMDRGAGTGGSEGAIDPLAFLEGVHEGCTTTGGAKMPFCNYKSSLTLNDITLVY